MQDERPALTTDLRRFAQFLKGFLKVLGGFLCFSWFLKLLSDSLILLGNGRIGGSDTAGSGMQIGAPNTKSRHSNGGIITVAVILHPAQPSSRYASLLLPLQSMV